MTLTILHMSNEVAINATPRRIIEEHATTLWPTEHDNARAFVETNSAKGSVWMHTLVHGQSDTGEPRTYRIFDIRLPSGETITTDAETERGQTLIIPETRALTITDTTAYARSLVAISEYLQTAMFDA